VGRVLQLGFLAFPAAHALARFVISDRSIHCIFLAAGPVTTAINNLVVNTLAVEARRSVFPPDTIPVFIETVFELVLTHTVAAAAITLPLTAQAATAAPGSAFTSSLALLRIHVLKIFQVTTIL
jgi:hypothetical protein